MNGTTLSLSSLYAPIGADLLVAERHFDRELAGDLDFVNGLCETARSYRGKMLRPALLLLSARAAGDLSEAHHTLAAVVELVHVATLVHDDVLDEADRRRQRPTIRSLHGNVAAVLLGDYLISHAFHLCSSIPDRWASQRIGATTNQVCEGELLQNYLRGRIDLSEAAYLDIVRRKTAALTATACELGAYYAGADETVVVAMRGYGESAGIAFQIVDDCLDFTGDGALLGKDLGRDLPSGKLTLPAIHYLGRASTASRERIREILNGAQGFDRAWLGEELRASGSLDYAREVAESYVADARQRLHELPPSDARSSLLAMAEFVTHRAF